MVSVNICFDAEYFNATIIFFVQNEKKIVKYWDKYGDLSRILTCIDESFIIIDELEQFFLIHEDQYESKNDKSRHRAHINGLCGFDEFFCFEKYIRHITNKK